MIKNTVTTEDIFELEAGLVDFLRSDQTDYDTQIEQAYNIMLLDLRNIGYDLRLLNTPLDLGSNTSSSSVTGDVSSKDYLNRNLLTIVCTSVSGNAMFSLYGSDDKSTWNDVLTDKVINESGTYNYVINLFYKYYRLDKTNSVQTTYSAYLSENVYYYMILYKSISLISNSLRRLPNRNNWEDKYIEYEEKYKALLNGASFSVDVDEDGSIDSDEARNSNVIRISLA